MLDGNPARHQDKYKSQYNLYLLFYNYIPNRKKDIMSIAAINNKLPIIARIQGKRIKASIL